MVDLRAGPLHESRVLHIDRDALCELSIGDDREPSAAWLKRPTYREREALAPSLRHILHDITKECQRGCNNKNTCR